MTTHIINSQAISHIYGSPPFCTAGSAFEGISWQMWPTTMQLFWSASGKPHQTPTRKTQQTPLQWGSLLGTWRAVRQVMWRSSRCRGWRAGRLLSVALTWISSDRVNMAVSCTQCTEEPLHSETEPTYVSTVTVMVSSNKLMWSMSVQSANEMPTSNSLQSILFKCSLKIFSLGIQTDLL